MKLTNNYYWLIPALVLFLAIPSLSYAGVAPPPDLGVYTSAIARYQDAADGPFDDFDPAVVATQAIVLPTGNPVDCQPGFFDCAFGIAEATIPGGVASMSMAGGAFPATNPVQQDVVANSQALQVTQWVATSSNPGVTTADIDVDVFIDGLLYTGDFAGVGPGDITAEAILDLRSTSTSGISNVFHGDALLDDTVLNVNGDWTAGDFTTDMIGSETQYSVDFSTSLSNAFTVTVGVPFTWEVDLATNARVAGPFELLAMSNFFGTASGVLSTDDPFITLEQIPVVPEPVSTILFIVGGATLGIRQWGKRRKA